MRLYELMSDYTVQAKGPAAVRNWFDLMSIKPEVLKSECVDVQTEELANFSQTVIRLELADWTEKLEKIRQHDLDGIQASAVNFSLALFTRY